MAAPRHAVLTLEDGRAFIGRPLGAHVLGQGEVVFNTAMTGYQEVLTDASYAGQMLCMTYPLQGNYGTRPADRESYLGPEMKSTGEVMGVDRTLAAAMRKAFEAAGTVLPPVGGSALLISDADEPEMLAIAARLTRLGYRIHATRGTALALERAGFCPSQAARIGEPGPTVLDLIVGGRVDLVVNTVNGVAGPAGRGHPAVRDGFEIRRAAVERGIPCLTSLDTAAALIESTWQAGGGGFEVRTITEWRAGSRREVLMPEPATADASAGGAG